jgi:hypothetical protein
MHEAAYRLLAVLLKANPVETIINEELMEIPSPPLNPTQQITKRRSKQ